MYQHIIQEVLQRCKGVNNISDYLIVYGCDKAKNRRRLEAVLKHLSEKGPTLNKGKAKFYMSKLTSMAHVLSKHGIAPDDNKDSAESNSNRTLLKAIRAEHVEGRDLRRELNAHLLANRSTNHSVTGVSSAELLFIRTIRTKLPSSNLLAPTRRMWSRECMIVTRV